MEPTSEILGAAAALSAITSAAVYLAADRFYGTLGTTLGLSITQILVNFVSVSQSFARSSTFCVTVGHPLPIP